MLLHSRDNYTFEDLADIGHYKTFAESITVDKSLNGLDITSVSVCANVDCKAKCFVNEAKLIKIFYMF